MTEVAKTDENKRETIDLVTAAKLLGIGRNQAYAAAHRGELPAIRIGRRWIVPTAALDKMLRGETA